MSSAIWQQQTAATTTNLCAQCRPAVVDCAVVVVVGVVVVDGVVVVVVSVHETRPY